MRSAAAARPFASAPGGEPGTTGTPGRFHTRARAELAAHLLHRRCRRTDPDEAGARDRAGERGDSRRGIRSRGARRPRRIRARPRAGGRSRGRSRRAGPLRARRRDRTRARAATRHRPPRAPRRSRSPSRARCARRGRRSRLGWRSRSRFTVGRTSLRAAPLPALPVRPDAVDLHLGGEPPAVVLEDPQRSPRGSAGDRFAAGRSRARGRPRPRPRRCRARAPGRPCRRCRTRRGSRRGSATCPGSRRGSGRPRAGSRSCRCRGSPPRRRRPAPRDATGASAARTPCVEVRAAVGEVAGDLPVADVVDQDGDVPVELVPVRAHVAERAEESRLLAREEDEADRALRPRARGDRPRHVDDERAVDAVVEGPGAEVPRVEVRAEEHDLVRPSRRRGSPRRRSAASPGPPTRLRMSSVTRGAAPASTRRARRSPSSRATCAIGMGAIGPHVIVWR